MQQKNMLKKRNHPEPKMWLYTICPIALLLMTIFGNAQSLPTNTDPTRSPVNINLPRTPESAAFEKYGTYGVNDVTGTPDISFPIYSVAGRALEAPITLTYDASGIKVNQEASWVGLGFNLAVGGRITVETKGCLDNDVITSRFFSQQTLKAGIQALFTRLGGSNRSAALGYAYTYMNSPAGNSTDDWASVNAMAQFGLGEPDIFHANFMGKSFDFYFDAIADTLCFLGERNKFNIAPYRDANQRLISFAVTDNEGVKYFFDQPEITTMALPTLGTIFGNTTTTAWLLTKALHPNGDSITFSYTNFGNTYPTFSRSGSITFNNPIDVANPSNDYIQDTIIQQPAYLTHIESAGTAVDFLLSRREDLRGAGSRRLDEIRVTDKLSNVLKKRVVFGYGYFYGDVTLCDITLPDSMRSYNTERLQLLTLSLDDPAQAKTTPPYQFYYYGTAQNKYSTGQDHWGYCNNYISTTTFGLCSPKNLIPQTGSEGNDLSYSTLASINEGRDCYPLTLPNMTLDSIIYPTGGSTKFIYEPHLSTKSYPRMTPDGSNEGVSDISLTFTTGTIIGGGQRIKTIRNYAFGKLASTTDYTYTSGIYFGAIRYNTTSYKFASCLTTPGSGFVDLLTPYGAVNDNDFLIGYGTVTEARSDGNGHTNGTTVKQFNLTPPWFTSNNPGGLGFDVLAPIWPNNSTGISTSMLTLAPPYTSFAPTPTKGLDGKIAHEGNYDSGGNLLRSVDYFYQLADNSRNYYSAKVMDNWIGGADGYSSACNNGGTEFMSNGAHRFTFFVSPAKSYHTLTDSVVETTYQSGNALKETKSYTYDENYQVKTQTTDNSDGTKSVTSFNYPYDLTTSQIYQDMRNDHIFSPVVQTSVSQGGTPVSFSQIDYFSPSQGLYVPQDLQVQIADNAIENRRSFNAYDVYGNLLEEQKDNGVKVDYLYGYASRYIVAKVIGSNRTAIAGLVNQSTLDNPTDDINLRNYLNTALRQKLPNALVTTYTQSPLIGITSETDARGITTYYEWDGIGRLVRTRDNDNNIIKQYNYNFGQQVSYTYQNAAQSGTFSKSCSPGYGASAEYDVPAGKYGSFVSQYQADSLAMVELTTNGPLAAQSTTCTAQYSFTPCCGWGTVYSNFALDGAGNVNFSIVLTRNNPSLSSGQIGTLTGAAFLPISTRTVQITASGHNYTLQFQPTGEVYIYAGNSSDSYFQLSGSYPL